MKRFPVLVLILTKEGNWSHSRKTIIRVKIGNFSKLRPSVASSLHIPSILAQNSRRVQDEESRASIFFHPCWAVSHSHGVRFAAHRGARQGCFGRGKRPDLCGTGANGIRKDCFCGEEFVYSDRRTGGNQSAARADPEHSQDHEFQDRQEHHDRWQLESWR